MSALIQPRESRTVEDLLKAGQLTRVVADPHIPVYSRTSIAP